MIMFHLRIHSTFSLPLFHCFVHLKLVLKNNRNRSQTYCYRAVFLVEHHFSEEARRLQSLIMNQGSGVGEKMGTGVRVERKGVGQALVGGLLPAKLPPELTTGSLVSGGLMVRKQEDTLGLYITSTSFDLQIF